MRFDWADRDTHKVALDGAAAVYLVAPIGAADPAPMVELFLQDAVDLGVRRVIALSSSALPEGAPGLGQVHHLVRTMMPEWAVLRPSWFMQNFTGDHVVAQGVRRGVIVTATGTGRIAFVDAGDIAAVAVRALTDDVPHNTEHLITGPQALSYADTTLVVSEFVDHPVRHRPVSAATFAALLTGSGVPADFAEILAALDTEIAGGAEDRLTDTVFEVTGRAPVSFREFCAAAFC
ncbi:NmrA family protein [Mycolicibacterium chitae]|uniref:NmrA family protein n=1 Tax=Mycolicibacterium chitae TaxID=1792 RepID=A0A3S5EIU0_MYCCI|nr:NmrA family protein [Mycolicibacterium chitae]